MAGTCFLEKACLLLPSNSSKAHPAALAALRLVSGSLASWALALEPCSSDCGNTQWWHRGQGWPCILGPSCRGPWSLLPRPCSAFSGDQNTLGKVVGAVGCEGCVGKSINSSCLEGHTSASALLGVKIQMVKGKKKKKIYGFLNQKAPEKHFRSGVVRWHTARALAGWSKAPESLFARWLSIPGHSPAV